MKKLFITLILLSLGGTGLADTKYKSLPALSINKAVKQALKRKPSVHAFEYNIKSARSEQKEKLSTYLPHVSISEGFYNSNYSSNIKSTFKVSASQTVLNPAQQDYYKVFTSKLALARHQKESHKDDIRLATEGAFLNGWLLQQKLDFIILLYNSTKENFAKAENQYKLKLLNKNDWLKAKTTYSAGLTTVSTYQDDIADAERTLEYYTGGTLGLLPRKGKKTDRKLTRLDWRPSAYINLKPLSYYYAQGKINRKDLKAKQAEIDTQKHTGDYYAKQYAPVFKVFANATKSRIRGSKGTLSKEGGLQVSWNIFDGLSSYFNSNAAHSRKTKGILEKSDLLAQVKLEIQQAYSSLQKEIKTFETEKISFNQAKNEFKLRSKEFKLGIISDTDFETAKYTYESARFSWLSQQMKTGLKKLELLRACGYPSA